MLCCRAAPHCCMCCACAPLCALCRAVVKDVEQQFKYTQPVICPNATCGNKCVQFHMLHVQHFVLLCGHMRAAAGDCWCREGSSSQLQHQAGAACPCQAFSGCASPPMHGEATGTHFAWCPPTLSRTAPQPTLPPTTTHVQDPLVPGDGSVYLCGLAEGQGAGEPG